MTAGSHHYQQKEDEVGGGGSSPRDRYLYCHLLYGVFSSVPPEFGPSTHNYMSLWIHMPPNATELSQPRHGAPSCKLIPHHQHLPLHRVRHGRGGGGMNPLKQRGAHVLK